METLTKSISGLWEAGRVLRPLLGCEAGYLPHKLSRLGTGQGGRRPRELYGPGSTVYPHRLIRQAPC